MNSMKYLTFGERLQCERKLHHWSQADLAKQAKIGKASIQRWEKDHSSPSTTSLRMLCELFEKEVKYWGIPLKEPIWNISLPRNQFFTGRENILIKLHASLIARDDYTAITQIHAITGLGGIGKTQVALEYAYRYRNEYEAVLWVGADSLQSIFSNFASLAFTLGLPEKNEADQEQIIKAVNRWLNTHPFWLLIFDNVNSIDEITAFLPEGGKGSILITTRTQILGTSVKKRFKLEKMDQDEAVRLLLHRSRLIQEGELNLLSDLEQLNAKRLYKYLGGLPLALSQAAAYIEQTDTKLADYIDLLQTYPKQILDQGKLSEYEGTVATTWAVSFQRIEKDYPLAADLLRICAFLHPDGIPLEMLQKGKDELNANLQIILNNPLLFHQTVKTLKQYSLVQQNSSGSLAVHRLVQITILFTLSNDALNVWETQVIRALNEAFPQGEIANWSICEKYLPHTLACIDFNEKSGTIIPELASLLNRMGDYLQERSRYREAEPLLLKSLKIREELLGLSHPDIAKSLHSLAWLYYLGGRYSEVESLYQRGLEIRVQMLGSDHPDTLGIQNDLALLYWKLHNYEKAEPLLQKTLATRQRLRGDMHIDTAESLNNIGLLFAEQQKYEEAEAYIKSFAKIVKFLRGTKHTHTAIALNNLGMLYYQQKKYEDAIPLLEEALSIREMQLGNEHSYTTISFHNLALVYAAIGKDKEAEKFFRQALLIREQQLGTEHPDVAITLHHLAHFLYERQRYTEAEPLYHRALEIRRNIFGSTYSDTVITENEYKKTTEKLNNDFTS